MHFRNPSSGSFKVFQIRLQFVNIPFVSILFTYIYPVPVHAADRYFLSIYTLNNSTNEITICCYRGVEPLARVVPYYVVHVRE